MRSVVLLRGVNLGSHNKIAMADLARWLEEVGFTSVRTYIQSGNVVLEHAAPRVGARVAASADATNDATDDVARLVHQTIVERCGLDVKVMVRSALELRQVVDANPYVGASPTQLHVSFFDQPPDASTMARLQALDFSPEEFTPAGRTIYLHLPHGMGRSAMVPRLRVLKDATTRNWNTVLALCDLAELTQR